MLRMIEHYLYSSENHEGDLIPEQDLSAIMLNEAVLRWPSQRKCRTEWRAELDFDQRIAREMRMIQAQRAGGVPIFAVPTLAGAAVINFRPNATRALENGTTDGC